MSKTLRLFLVVAERNNGAPAVEDVGTDFKAAQERFKAAEHEHDGNPDVEVALLGSDSLETLQVTHSSYFPDVLQENTRRLLAKAGL